MAQASEARPGADADPMPAPPAPSSATLPAPEPPPVPDSVEPVRSGSPWRLAIPMLLAAGWGGLLTFSFVALMEDGRGTAAPAAQRAAAESADPGAGPFASRPRPHGHETARGDGRGGGADAVVRLVSIAADAPTAPRAAAAAGRTTSERASLEREAVERAAPERGEGERPDYVGTWGPTARACGTRRRGYLPATITEAGARAGRTACRFRNGRREGPVWSVAADCSEHGRRWTSQVRLLVDGDRLTWTSAKGATLYVRCGRRDG